MRYTIRHFLLVSIFAVPLPCPCEVPGYLRDVVDRIKPYRNALTAYPVSGPYGRPVQALFSSNGSTWAGTDNGMYVSEDPAKGWRALNYQGESHDEDAPQGASAFAKIGNALFVGDVYDIFRSDDAGRSWKKWLPVSVTEGNLMPVTGLVALKDRLLISTTSGVYESDLSKKHLAICEGLGEHWVHTMSEQNGTVFAFTADGVFASSNLGATWKNIPVRFTSVLAPKNLDARLFSIAPAGASSWILATGGQLFQLDSVDADPRFIVALPHRDPPDSIAVTPSGILLGTESGVFSLKDSDKTWVLVNQGIWPGWIRSVKQLGTTVYASSLVPDYRLSEGLTGSHRRPRRLREQDPLNFDSGEVFLSTNLGQSWTPILPGAFDAIGIIDRDHISLNQAGKVTTAGKTPLKLSTLPVEALPFPTARIQGTVYLARPSRLIASQDGGKSWEPDPLFPVSEQAVSLASAGTSLFAGTLDGGLYRLSKATKSTEWHRLAADGLSGAVRALWVDDRYPDVVIAGTSRGLFWSGDSGNTFRRYQAPPGLASFSRVDSLDYTNGTLLIGTDQGVFYVVDRIPRGMWYQRVFEWAKKNPKISLAGIGSIIVLFVFSTRTILFLLQFEVWPLSALAPWFYLTPFGRWKLYRRYRLNVKKDAAIQDATRFVDLPFDMPDGGKSQERLSASAEAEVAKNGRLIVLGEGGQGKSTLCHYLALQTAQRSLRAKKRLEPVLIEGLDYSGNLLTAITNTLKQHRAYVNSQIVESQLLAGNLLVILDGFSEIREAYRSAADTADIPDFLQNHPDTPFVLASRSYPFATIRRAMGEAIVLQLQDVDEKTEQVFLAQYLKRGAKDVDLLMGEIQRRFPGLPRIPLMLQLVATVYEKTGQVPKDRTTLFADYLIQLLRPQVTGIDEPAGLSFAIRHLVRESFLRSGGDRGISVERGVELLEGIKTRLESFDIKLSPVGLLNLLSRAGLYRRTSENLKFFHDSFESYFAARAMESDFREKRPDLIIASHNNPRLAETWSFLHEMLESSTEVERLNDLLGPTKENAAVTSPSKG